MTGAIVAASYALFATELSRNAKRAGNDRRERQHAGCAVLLLYVAFLLAVAHWISR